LAAKKQQMGVAFERNRLRPGESGYVYDKKGWPRPRSPRTHARSRAHSQTVDFGDGPTLPSEWDAEDDGNADAAATAAADDDDVVL
jgi:hypothetical protein